MLESSINAGKRIIRKEFLMIIRDKDRWKGEDEY